MAIWITISCGCHGGIVSCMGMPEECPSCNGSGRLWVTAKDRLASYPGGPFVGYEPGIYAKEIERGAKVVLKDGVWTDQDCINVKET